MQYGTVKNWDSSKGFGFIITDEDEDLFMHQSDFDITLQPSQVKEGMRVKFDVKSDFKGDRAIRVRKA